MKKLLNDSPNIWIQTSDEQKGIWSMLDFLTVPSNAKKVLEQKFDRNKYQRLSKLKKHIQQNNLESFRVLKTEDFDKQSFIISSSIKQASEYFQAAQNSTALVSPVLFYYGMIAFGNALTNSLVVYGSNAKNHGLQIDKKTFMAVHIRKKGFFPRLHNMYLSDTWFLKEPKFSFQELMSINNDFHTDYIFTYDEEPLLLRKRKQIMLDEHPRKEKIGDLVKDKILLHEIDHYFLGMFILSSYSRYRPKEWSELMSGINSGESFIIKRFLEKAQIRFPHLLLTEIFDKEFQFGPAARWG